MYIRLVTFKLAGGSADDYERQAEGLAEAFNAWAGLRAKIWLADRDRRTFGGVYLFDAKASADESRSTPLFAALAEGQGVTDLSIEEFDTLPVPTSITAPWLMSGLHTNAVE